VEQIKFYWRNEMSEIINEYAKTRKRIHNWLDSKNIPSNDNIVGRIGSITQLIIFSGSFLIYQLFRQVRPIKKDMTFVLGLKDIPLRQLQKKTSPVQLPQ
jgi:hypothetical protein